MTETEIKSYLLRLYAIHEKTHGAACDLQVALLKGAETGYPISPDVARYANELDYQTDQLEQIFAETLTDQERNIPTDEEFSMMVNSLLGKDGEIFPDSLDTE